MPTNNKRFGLSLNRLNDLPFSAGDTTVAGRKLDKVWYLAMTNPSDGFRKSRPFKSKRALLIGIITLYPLRLILALLNFL